MPEPDAPTRVALFDKAPVFDSFRIGPAEPSSVKDPLMPLPLVMLTVPAEMEVFPV